MSEAEQRARIAALARAWIGLPYYHQQRLRGVGGDCTFFALVYEDAGLIPHLEIPSYSPQAHLHTEAAVYENIIREHAHQTEVPEIGDLVLYKFGRAFSHGGVIVDPGWPTIVHGNMEAGRIMLGEGNLGRFAEVKRKFFTLFPRT